MFKMYLVYSFSKCFAPVWFTKVRVSMRKLLRHEKQTKCAHTRKETSSGFLFLTVRNSLKCGQKMEFSWGKMKKWKGSLITK